MNFRKIVLLIAFFAVLLTSLFPQNIYLLVVFSVMVWVLLPFKRFWSGASMSLFLFSIFYTIMVVLSGRMTSGFFAISYLISPVAFYRFGQYLMVEHVEDRSRYKLLLFIVFAYLLNAFVLTFIDIAVVGIVNEDRTLLGTSTEDDALAATLYGLMASVGIGCIGACFAKRQKLFVRLCYLLIVLLSLLVVVHLINRGGLVILVVCLTFTVLINYMKSLGKLLIVVVALVIGVSILLNCKVLNSDILQAYQYRNEVGGYGLDSAGGRTELWMKSLENMFKYPMGWEQGFYAHNLWIDMAKIGGWISLIPFLMVTVTVICRVLTLFRKGNSSFSRVIIVLNIAMLLAAFIEPVIESSILYFSLLMLIWGITVAISNEGKIIIK